MKKEVKPMHNIETSVCSLGRNASLHCLTVNGRGATPGGGILRRAAAASGAAIVQHFIFSDRARRARLPGPDAEGGDAPEVRIEHLPGEGVSMFAVQAIAAGGAKNIRPVKAGGMTIGLCYEDDCARYCRLGSVADADSNAARPDQARKVFDTMKKALDRNGFDFTRTVRTWFYNDRITEWYEDFNRVRNGFFEETGVFAGTVPASTGIGAGNTRGAALVGNLFAIQPKNGLVKIRAVASPLQDSALEYKSSFSRAIELEYPSGRLLMISGTASIDKHGLTRHTGNASAQIELTMEVAAALLKSRGMGWENALRGIAYFKSTAGPGLFNEYCRKNHLAPRNIACAFTDMCRDDLLFEIELDAFAAGLSGA